MMCYLRQQCRKRPPDVLLQREYDSESCDSDENHAEIDYTDDDDDGNDDNDDNDDNDKHSPNSPSSPTSPSDVVIGRIDNGVHNEIPQPMHEYHEEFFHDDLDLDSDSDSDSEREFRQSYSFLVRRHIITDQKSDIQKSAVFSCCVCDTSVQQQRIRLDELDHHPSFQFQEDMGFLNPCKKHTTCVSCIRKSLLVGQHSGESSQVIRDGCGTYPCLGDVNCKNTLQQRTTTFIHQLRELFTDIEWNSITSQIRNFRASQVMFDHHPYLSPLIGTADVTVTILCDRIIDILNQDEQHVLCPICTVTIQKTTACYAMRHCDWEICWMCGKIDRRLSIDHWKTCPRYDSNAYWKKHDYLCLETICYDEDRVCKIPTHERGKMNMNHIRQVFQLYHLYTSVTSEMKSIVDTTIQHKWPIQFQKMTRLLKEYGAYKF